MRFIVNGLFVQDTFTNTQRSVNSVQQAYLEATRLNDYMITHSNYEVVDGFEFNFRLSDEVKRRFVEEVAGA